MPEPAGPLRPVAAQLLPRPPPVVVPVEDVAAVRLLKAAVEEKAVEVADSR